MKKIIGLILFLICLTSTLSARVYEHVDGNKLTLLEDPERSFDHKIELIKNSKHHINILTFYWDDSTIPDLMARELSNAHARGVEVRILTSWIPTIGTDFFGKGRKNLKAKSKAIFSYLSLTPGREFSLTHSLHEKIFSVDGEIAIIGGRNISDSSLSGKDMEVQIEGPVVNQVQDHFKRMFDFVVSLKIKRQCVHLESSEDCENNFKKLIFPIKNKRFFPKQPIFEDGVPARIISHEAILHQYEKGMTRAERLNQQDDILDTVTKFEFKKMRAYNYFIMPTKRYREFIETSLAAGNSIEIITNGLESAKFSSNWGYYYSIPDALDLVQKGLELYQWQRKQKLNYVHEKVLIFDEERVIIGSHNFGTGSTGVSNEIVIDFKSKVIAQRLTDIFESEKTNPNITKKVDVDFLVNESRLYKRMIKYVRMKLVSGVLKEIY